MNEKLTQIEFTYALPSDAKEISKLQCKSYKRDFIKATEWKELLCNPLQPTVVIKSEPNGPIVAVIRTKVELEVLVIKNLFVHPEFRRIGVGSFLLTWLKGEAISSNRNIITHCREHNLDFQLLLKKNQFLYTKTEKDYHHDPIEDRYTFQWTNSDQLENDPLLQ